MSEHNEPFLPEWVDEQIDALTWPAAQPTPRARLISDLRTVYSEDTEIVEQVRVRLAGQLAAGRQSSTGEGNAPRVLPANQRKGPQPMPTFPSEQPGEPAAAPGASVGAPFTKQNKREPRTPGSLERSERSGRFERRPEQPRNNRRSRLLELLVAVLVIAALLGGTTFLLRSRQAAVIPVGKPVPARPTSTVSGPTSTPSTAVVARGLYITTTNAVARVDLQSGKTLWQVPASFSAQPVILGNVVIVSSTADHFDVSNKSYIEGINANNGQVLWHVSNQASYLQGAKGIVYASGCSDMGWPAGLVCAILAINATTGVLLWSYKTPTGTAWITLQNGVLYGASVSRYFALNIATGQPLWQKTFPTPQNAASGQASAAPVLSNHALYIPVCDGKPDANAPHCALQAFDASDGTTLWNVALFGQAIASPTLVGNTVYIGTTDGNIFALDASQSQGATNVVGPSQINGQITQPLLIINGLLYVEIKPATGNPNTHLIVIDTTNWTTRWSQNLQAISGIGPDWRTLAISNGQLYAVNGQYSISVLNASDGKVVRSYKLADTSPIVGFALVV